MIVGQSYRIVRGGVRYEERSMVSRPQCLAARIRVLVADTTRIHTHLLADALRTDCSFEVIPFESPGESVISVANGLNIDVVVINANLDEHESHGLDVVRELRASNPKIRCVVLMDSRRDDLVVNAFASGARGIFGKSHPVDLLCKCVRRVHEGQIWADTREIILVLEALANAPGIRAVDARGLSLLSKRELQVVHCWPKVSAIAR